MVNLFVICMVLIRFYNEVEGVVQKVPYPKEALMDTDELITKNGYPLEIHYVTTKDGYILKIQRIPIGSHCEDSRRKKPYPLLAVHGIAVTARSFVMIKKGFAYAASDHCYDVWLPNTRGNYESRNHTFLDPNEAKFWEFEVYEKGVYDIPAVIDYVLHATNATQVQYVGHSQGTSIVFALASYFPEYSVKTIRSVHGLAPIGFTKNAKTPIFTHLSPHVRLLQDLLNKEGIFEIPNLSYISQELSQYLCRLQQPISRNLCAILGFQFAGNGKREFNATSYMTFHGFYPAGFSVRELIVALQSQHSGKVTRIDLYEDNLKVYGQPTPPEYSMITSSLPIYLYASDNDFFAVPADVTLTMKFIPNAIRVDNSKFAHFNHFDFLIGNNVDIVNDEVLKNMAMHN